MLFHLVICNCISGMINISLQQEVKTK